MSEECPKGGEHEYWAEDVTYEHGRRLSGKYTTEVAVCNRCGEVSRRTYPN